MGEADTMTAEATLELIQDPRRAVALLHPLRLEILKALVEPASSSGIAERLGLSRQRINYHLRALERDGLVELVEERRKGNCVERMLRATAQFYIISPEVLGTLSTKPAQFKDQFSSSYLVALAAKAIREVALLRERAKRAKKRLATFSLHTEVRFASASEQSAFTKELAVAISELVSKYHNAESPNGRSFQFILGVYPTLKQDGTN
jgi:DNA-binding transcriptional ArsR family regulator